MSPKVAIIGTGQQGTSIARALHLNGDHKYSLILHDKDPRNLKDAYRAIRYGDTSATENLQEAVRDANIVILATPMSEFGALAEQIGPALKEGAIVTDIGSGKQKAIQTIQYRLPSDVIYIPVHPLVGRAGTGPASSDAEMYEGQPIVFVPVDKSRKQAQETIKSLWHDIGGRDIDMSAETHDKLYGTISHFEHVVAFALTAVGEDSHNPGKACKDYQLGGNSLLATTRIAAASIPMWQAIFVDNKKAILEAADGFRLYLNELKRTLAENDFDNMLALFGSANLFRSYVKDTFLREGIVSEIMDIKPADGSLNSVFNAQDSFAMRVGLASLIGGAIAMNAIDVESNLKDVSIAENSNPSFRDGSAPMLTDPMFLTTILLGNKESLMAALEKFEAELDHIVAAIEAEDTNEMAKIIERVSSIRADMPPHKTELDFRSSRLRPNPHGNLVRDNYVPLEPDNN